VHNWIHAFIYVDVHSVSFLLHALFQCNIFHLSSSKIYVCQIWWGLFFNKGKWPFNLLLDLNNLIVSKVLRDYYTFDIVLTIWMARYWLVLLCNENRNEFVFELCILRYLDICIVYFTFILIVLYYYLLLDWILQFS
jgi:hypothetical protein